MDITFDIHNGKGDQVRVALAYYGTEIMQVFTDDPLILTLEFYDVTLVRISGDKPVGIKTLKAICEILSRFMNENETAVLCFYCDDLTEVPRNHPELTPQEYRSRLFSRMFDMHVHNNSISGVINYVIKIEEDTKPRFAHFITPEKYLPEVKLLEKLIREK